MLLVDVGIALLVAIVLSWLLLHFSAQSGSWRNRWAIGSVLFLCAWAGGAWFSPIHVGSWLTYWLPFAAVGLVAALLVAIASPLHLLATDEDRFGIGMAAQKCQRGRHGHGRTVIATHAVDRNGDTHRVLA